MILTSIPSPPQAVWYLGPIPLRAYAIAIITGIVVAWFIAEKRYIAKGGPKDVSLDITVWMVIFGIVGARAYHVVSSPDAYFGPDGDLSKIIRVWEGGLGIWGGIALGAVGGAIALRRRNLRFGPFADAVAPGILIAQAIGRLGNYFNQELFGGPTDLPWGLEIDDAHLPAGFASGTTFHPTFLYEALWCLAMAALLFWLEKRYNLRGGQVIVAYVMLYTLGRVWIEYLRIDTAKIIFGLRLNVWVSIIIFSLAALTFVWLSRRLKEHPEIEDIRLDPTKPIPGEDAAPAVDSAETDSAETDSDESESDDDAETLASDTPTSENADASEK